MRVAHISILLCLASGAVINGGFLAYIGGRAALAAMGF